PGARAPGHTGPSPSAGRAWRASRGALAEQVEPWYGPAQRPAARKHAKPRLSLVPDPKTVRARRLSGLFTGVTLIAVCFGLFGVIGMHVLLAQGQDDVQDLQSRLAVEQEREQDLSLEVARLQAPAAVVAAAKARGMVVPTTVVALNAASLDSPPRTTIPAPAPATTPTTAQTGPANSATATAASAAAASTSATTPNSTRP
ncbi:MAG: hypothetical protein ACRD2W_04300, partial [Acidimicrobiales bacterium]